MKQLRHLDLTCNDFGKIQVPRFIGSLGELRYLNLSNSNFGGNIPPQLGNLSKLHILCVGSSYFPYESSNESVVSSNIDSFGNLTSLESLKVKGNSFMNSSLVLEGLSRGIGRNLISLDISACGISSSDLDSLHNMTSLLSLDLSENRLTKTIPKSLCNFCDLRVIDLSLNDFQDGLTHLLEIFFKCNTPALESLSIFASGLSRNLPRQLVHLEHLRLNYNKIVGTIPDSIGRLSFLKTLDLSKNLISGPIPYSIGQLSSLEVLKLSDNQLNGSLPNSLDRSTLEIGRIKFLFQFSDRASNSAVAGISKGVNSIKNKQHWYFFTHARVNLSRNQLTGRIPEKIGDMQQLESFDLSLNNLCGELPMSLSRLNFLSGFNVSHNNLTGRIPSSTQLQSLNESCYIGNELCGDPLTQRCIQLEGPDTRHEEGDDDDEEDDGSHGADLALAISTVLGFMVGFWVIVAPLIVSRSWRITFFSFLD